MKKRIFYLTLCFYPLFLFSQGMIIDHTCTDLSTIDSLAIEQAKDSLHIAYGHTSHGSQLTTGMTGLVGEDSLIGYKGDIYDWNEGGTGGALDIDDYFGSGDLGHTGDTSWAPITRTYLASHTDVNVIMYSWCGGCSDNTVEGIQIYLDKMNQLESDYPNVTFIYMTGHSDIWRDDTLKRNNQMIKDYCVANNKVLFDFYDIERYNPDGTFFEYTNDNCNYYDSSTTLLGNWATEWQDSHTEGIDWYNCYSAHSEYLNANLKAYAAWWMWCRLAGWDDTTVIDNNPTLPTKFELKQNYPNPFNPSTTIKISIPETGFVSLVIYNMIGQKATTLINEVKSQGTYDINFNASGLSSGIYFYRIIAGNYSKTKKLVLMK